MNQINFQEEFAKIARSQGMGEVISASVICHEARGVLKDVFPEGKGEVISFKNGLLTIHFGNSSALARFEMFKEEFLGALNKCNSKNSVTEVKAVLG